VLCKYKDTLTSVAAPSHVLKSVPIASFVRLGPLVICCCRWPAFSVHSLHAHSPCSTWHRFLCLFVCPHSTRNSHSIVIGGVMNLPFEYSRLSVHLISLVFNCVPFFTFPTRVLGNRGVISATNLLATIQYPKSNSPAIVTQIMPYTLTLMNLPIISPL